MNVVLLISNILVGVIGLAIGYVLRILKEKEDERMIRKIHLCDTCGCAYCADRDIFKPISYCPGYSKKR